MDYDFYTPPSNLVFAQDVRGEIDLINTMMASLDPKSPQYEEVMAHYYGQLDNLSKQLSRCPPAAVPEPSYPASNGTSNYQMPNGAPSYPKPYGGPSYSAQHGGSSYSASNGNSSSNRLQPDSTAYQLQSGPYFPGYTTSSLPVRPQQHGSRNTQSQVPIQPSNFIDLTLDDDDDPFIGTKNAFLPGVQPSFDNMNQGFMNNDQLANFLWDPTAPNIEIPAPPVRPPSTQFHGLNSQQNHNRVNLLMEDSHSTQRSSLMGLGGAPAWGNPFPDSDYDDFFDRHVPAHDEPEAVQDLIENIKFDQEVRPDQRKPTPVAMKSTLMEHQKIALTWLLMMEHNNTKGGILADEMGLGKTVQALALILANPSEDPACKTTLIVAPVALMRQWEKEIERHVKPHHRLKVFVCHNEGPRKKLWSSLRNYDVVLTTYGTLASQYKRKTNRIKQQQEQEKIQQELDKEQQGGEGGPKKRRRIAETHETDLGLVGRDCMWYRVILDEAQCIKNRDTWSSKAADDLQSRYRLAMTGTPMMNSVDELYSLVRFLKIPPYNSWAKFRMDVSAPLKKSDRMREQAMQRVQALLKSIMLRRCKTTLVDGKEICQIPPKETIIEHVKFSDEEMSLYKAIETNAQIQFNKYLERGTVNNNYANVLVMLLRLRQICCHPHLVKDLGVQASTENIAGEELEERAGMLSADVVNRLRNCAEEGFECPICYETVVNPTIFIPCGHTCCGDCFQKLIDPSRAIQQGVETSEARCPECRNTLSSKEITDFMHFCRVHMPELLEDLDVRDKSETDNDSEDDSDGESEDEGFGDDVNKNGDLRNFVVPDSDDDEEDVEEELTPCKDENEDVKPAKSQRKDKGKEKARTKKPKETLAQLKKDSLRNKDAKRRYLKRLRKQFQTSAKIEKTMELLSEIKARDPTEKTLVFSQFTSLLDLLEVPLQERKVKYQRYDGSMSMNDRADAVNQFMDNASETVFLISLKAGNAGLNLNKASQVIILDPFWNPFVEDQAVDRAHRMPQRREVKVHRVLVPETVEDRICALQDKKRDLINTAMDEGVGKQLTRLSVGELRYLFGLSRH